MRDVKWYSPIQKDSVEGTLKVRVIKTRGVWYGQVYGKHYVFGDRWNDVTSPCFTKVGAEAELRKWRERYEVK